MTVRTRFAPSPTGYLHIGGVRTALFNWLFARHHGGQFILRIDDTDQERNVAEALAPILHGFRWLGIDWDEGADIGGPNGPYYQSQRLERYQAAVKVLIDKGLAYYDYARPEELKAERDIAEKTKAPYRYSRTWMAQTREDRAKFESEGRPGVVRLLMPRDGACTYRDLIRGDMDVKWTQEQDHVIQRADGSCLYNLANVVDDYDMKITHVIRAQEHLSNTPRQIFIAQGLGYELPQYAHLPFVAEPGSSKKLSKREIPKYLKNSDFKSVYERGHAIARAMNLPCSPETFSPVIVDFYEQVGFLPHAIINALLMLGWALDDKTEYFTLDEMIRQFSLERVNLAPASFDAKKLLSFQEHYMQLEPVGKRVEMALPYLEKAGVIAAPPSDEARAKVTQMIVAAGDRMKIAGDILDYPDFFRADDQLTYDDTAFEKRIRKPTEAAGLLRKYREHLATVEPFDAATLEKQMHGFLKAEGVEIGKIIHALRVAVTGKAIGFGMFDTLAILGKGSALARINRALGRL